MDTRRESGLWFNRLLTYAWDWDANRDSVLAQIDDLHPQIIQIPGLGPLFYSAPYPPAQEEYHYSKDDIQEQLEKWRRCIEQIHRRGIKVVGFFSFCYHYGDPERRLGWFEFWDKLWDEERLGPQPDVDPTTLFQRTPDGQPIGTTDRRVIGGNVYYGCPNNPAWRQVLKAMVKDAIGLGMDGLIVAYNFRNICRCPFCREELKRYFGKYSPEVLRERFGIADIEDPAWLNFTVSYPYAFPQSPLEWLGLEATRCQHYWEKTRYDEIFMDYGRSLKPDLILAEWFHAYNLLGPNERSLLARDLWGKGEDYIWYCQGWSQTNLKIGYTADTTLGAKYSRAMGRGKPFVPNTYETFRYRLGIADMVASGGVAFGVHRPPEHEDDVRGFSSYFRFLREQEGYHHPATSYTQVALVYANQAMQLGDSRRLRTMRRLGHRMIDGHVPFDLLIDADLSPDALKPYRLLILANVKYLSAEQVEVIRVYVRAGGKLIATDETACCDENGTALPQSALEDVYGPHNDNESSLNPFGKGMCLYIPEVPKDERHHEQEYMDAIPPHPEEDVFGHDFLHQVRELVEVPLLETTASWMVEVTPYIQETHDRLVLHIVNYNRDESAPMEIHIPERDISISIRLPEARSASAVRQFSPDRDADESLPFEQHDGYVRFVVPELLVYNLVVVDTQRR